MLWARIAPLLVVAKPRKKPGRPRITDRPLFNGVIWLLRTGAQWAKMPPEFGPKSTVHDRFQEWVQTGAFARACPRPRRLWSVAPPARARCLTS